MTATRPTPAAKPRCIVMPLRPADGQATNGIGMGLHFMLGNIIVLHSGFKEFWFGWRYTKLFTDAAALTDYAHAAKSTIDITALGKQQDIRYWIEGWYELRASDIATRLVLTDAETGRQCHLDENLADPGDQYLGYRIAFMNWLTACGQPFPNVQTARALWSEEMPVEGLDTLGRGLEAYYLHTGYGGDGPVDTSLLDQAARLAPQAYLVHDLRGWILYKNKDYAGAEKAFRTAVDINPHGAGAMSGLMWLGIVSGNPKEAYAWAEAKAESCGTSIQKAREKAGRLLKKYADQS
jgi:tetratricopeptide (TPR) repeat protein